MKYNINVCFPNFYFPSGGQWWESNISWLGLGRWWWRLLDDWSSIFSYGSYSHHIPFWYFKLNIIHDSFHQCSTKLFSYFFLKYRLIYFLHLRKYLLFQMTANITVLAILPICTIKILESLFAWEHHSIL